MLNVKKSALRGASAIAFVRNEGDAAAEVKRMIDGINTEIKNRFDEQNKAWNAFKDEHSKGSKDVVSAEKVDKINADISKLGEEIDALNTRIAAASIAGTGENRAVSTEQKAYRNAFIGTGGYMRKGIENNLHDLAVKASMTEGSGPDGGWTVPVQTETTIDRILAKVSAMRNIASVMQISAGVYRKPTSQGGAASGWVGETDPRNQTATPKLSLIDFPAMELYAMPAATQTLLDDSIVDIESWLANEVSITFAEQEGAAFISGDGENKPTGLVSYGTVADAQYAWGKLGYIASGAAGDFADDDPADALIDLCYAPKQGYRVNGSFLMNRKTQAEVRKFKDSQDRYIWQPALSADQPASLLGYPVYTDDNMADVGANAFPIAFGDFKRGYLIVDRVGVRVLRDPFSAKPYVLFYTTKRVGGGVQNFEAIKLFKIAAN